jgi:hypothetical protein
MGDINFEETKAVWESRLVGKQIVDMGGNMTSVRTHDLRGGCRLR